MRSIIVAQIFSLLAVLNCLPASTSPLKPEVVEALVGVLYKGFTSSGKETFFNTE